MLTLDEMEYSASNDMTNVNGDYNEYYVGYLDNGDVLRLSRYGYYDNQLWEWNVYVPDKFPGERYAGNYRGHEMPSPEEALDDFEECYKPRTWMTQEEYRSSAGYGPEAYRCSQCGWEGEASELVPVDVREDYGDVCVSSCPSCGAVEYDGMEIFERVE